jgi:curved DNA-binding protein CbpA
MNRPKPAARGEFSKTPLAHLLIYGLEKKLTGSLEFTTPDGRSAALTLIEGHVTNARTSEAVAYLGRVLVDLAIISDETLNRTLLTVAQQKRLHGQVLIEQGIITEAQLKNGLREQLLRKLHHMFALPNDTHFDFFDAFDVLHGYGGDAVSTTDPLPVIWRAVCETPPWEHVHGTLARMQSARLRVTKTAAFQRFDFAKDILEIVDRIRERPMRISEVAALGMISPRVAQLLVYTLVITKQLELAEAPTSSPSPATTRAVSIASVPPARPGDPTSIPVTRSGEISSARMATAPAMPSVSSMPRMPALPSFPQRILSNSSASLLAATLSPELAERQNEIKTRAASIDKQDYFEMLGVKRDASPEVVQTTFFALAKKWHPDRLPRELESVRDECQRVFARLGEAHQTLMVPERRQNYMRLLKEGGATPDEQEAIATVIDAAQNFQRAEVLVKRNDLAQAEILCRKAHEADRQQADYLALLAWLESMKPENQSPKATLERIAMLDRAVAQSENCERAYFYRGMLHKKLSNAAPAMRDFRKAADLNPRNVDAVREVRLFEMRKGRSSTAPPPSNTPNPSVSRRLPSTRTSQLPEKSGGLLGKIFKK